MDDSWNTPNKNYSKSEKNIKRKKKILDFVNKLELMNKNQPFEKCFDKNKKRPKKI
jgi:hypothetical protein